MRIFGYLFAILAFAVPACAQTPSPDGSVRKMCSGPDQCVDVPYAEALKQLSMPLSPAAERSFDEGYVFVELAMRTTGGFVERYNCGGFIIDEPRRLVVTAQHCLPPYANQVDGALTADGIAATYVASLPEADITLLRLEKLPEGKRALPYKEAVVGEVVFGRSLQKTPFTNTPASKTVTDQSYFVGPVSFYGTVVAKGSIGVGRYIPGMNGKDSTYDIETSSQALRISGDAEPGFSGGPIYNLWGEVVGIVSGGAQGLVLAGSARDFPRLLAMVN